MCAFISEGNIGRFIVEMNWIDVCALTVEGFCRLVLKENVSVDSMDCVVGALFV